MTQDELARPLTAEEEAKFRESVRLLAPVSEGLQWANSAVVRLLATLDALRDTPVADTVELREALADANRIIAMTREHLEKDHPDCAYTGLGVLNDASRVRLAVADTAGIDAARLAEAITAATSKYDSRAWRLRADSIATEYDRLSAAALRTPQPEGERP